VSLIVAENISKRFGEKVTLETVSCAINLGERVALVGRNGTGKSTLLNILAGALKADSGRITRAKELRVNYIEQELDGYDELTLWEFVARGRPEIELLAESLHDLAHQLETRPYDDALLERYGNAQRAFEAAGGFDFEADVKQTLMALGFPEPRWQDRLNNFSGGERNRASLGRALIGEGNLLLLDEPTNHLDIASTEWLEERLVAGDKAVIVTSHDRTFLTRATTKVWDLSFGELVVYHNGFQSYLTERVERREHLQKKYDRQQEYIAKTEDFIRRNIAGQKTKQAQSRRKTLARLTREKSQRGERSAPAIQAPVAGRSFALALNVSKAAVGYGDTVILRDVSFELYRGERVGLIGPNGSGKSTLIKTLVGDLPPLSGSWDWGGQVELAYFDQRLDALDDTLTALEHMWQVDSRAEQGTLRDYLARFGFYGEEALTAIGSFSGGEKTKLALALLMYRPANFLILDEPTNHLDLESREALETALKSFGGACLIVSHDRTFLNEVTQRTIAVENGGVRVYNGPYGYYVAKLAEESQGEKTSALRITPKPKAAELSRDSERERTRRKAALEKQIRALHESLSENEAALARAEEAILHVIPKTDWQKLTEESARKTELEQTILLTYQEIENLTVEFQGLAESET